MPVIDDMYLDHVLNVGQIRTFDSQGQMASTVRLYAGDHPTGPELRNLLLSPGPLRVFHTGQGGLYATKGYIRDVELLEFISDDGSDTSLRH